MTTRFIPCCLSICWKKNHYTVKTARTAAEGLQLAIEHQPALIIVDLVLPDTEIDALTAIHRLRAELQQTPIIATSILDKYEAERIALEIGATSFLKKPFSKSELEQLIQHSND